MLILWGAFIAHEFVGQSWLTFRQALSLGGHVRKGERGTTVVYADRFTPDDERRRAAETGDEAQAIAFLKRFTVFKTAQCEGLPDDDGDGAAGRDRPRPAAGRGADPGNRRGLPDRRRAGLLRRFFVNPTVVKQRLRLAAVSPKLLDFYAEDGMTLEQLMAFTVTADHTRQEQIWDSVSRNHNKEPYLIRRQLTEGAVRVRPARTVRRHRGLRGRGWRGNARSVPAR